MPLSMVQVATRQLNMSLLRTLCSGRHHCSKRHHSAFLTNQQPVFQRSFHSLRVTSTQVRSLVTALDRTDPNWALRLIHTTSQAGKKEDGSQDQSGDGDGNKGRRPEDEDWEQKLAQFKSAIPVLFITAFLYSVLSRDGGGGAKSQDEAIRASRDAEDMSRAKQVPWLDFYNSMLMTGEVEDVIVHKATNRVYAVLHPSAIYKGQRVTNRFFRVNFPYADEIEDKIREAENKLGIPAGGGVSVKYDTTGEFGADILVLGIMAALGITFMMMRRGGGNMSAGGKSGGPAAGGGFNPFSKMTKADFTLVDPMIRTGKGIKFSDVAGLKQAKIEVKEFVDYLKNAEKYKELGAKPPKGAILFGPPGCGKTLLAKAVANESNVPFLSMNGSEFIEMIAGLGAARVRSLFAEARQRAPAIIYIDEIDAIGRKRSSGSGGGGSSGEGDQTLNQLLVELDGIASTEGVIMLASTNRADVLDRALLRPGRFDRQIEIDLPNLIERKEMLELHMRGVVLEEESKSNYTDRLSTLTPGFSGADLANLVNEAALHAARVQNKAVKRSDFEYAIERVIAGPEKKTSVLSPTERRVVAYHESGHAVVGWMLKHTDALLKVTILPRTSQALGFAQYTPVDKKLYSPDEFMDRMCMALGGRVAESLTFNKITTGATNDLEKVTKMAYAQIQNFGFNDTVGLVSFENDGGVKPYSKKMAATMDLEARKLIAVAYRRTESLLKANPEALQQMAEALLEKETLNYEDVELLLGEPPHGKKHLVSPTEYEQQLREQANMGEEASKAD